MRSRDCLQKACCSFFLVPFVHVHLRRFTALGVTLTLPRSTETPRRGPMLRINSRGYAPTLANLGTSWPCRGTGLGLLPELSIWRRGPHGARRRSQGRTHGRGTPLNWAIFQPDWRTWL